jgi:hypothetical protein
MVHPLILEEEMNPTTLCHRNDPETSFEAAEKMIKSGTLNKQEKEVWIAITDYLSHGDKDFTAKEIEGWNYQDYITIQRRLSGLKNKGKIERTGEKRNGCCVWRIKNA